MAQPIAFLFGGIPGMRRRREVRGAVMQSAMRRRVLRRIVFAAGAFALAACGLRLGRPARAAFASGRAAALPAARSWSRAQEQG